MLKQEQSCDLQNIKFSLNDHNFTTGIKKWCEKDRKFIFYCFTLVQYKAGFHD